MYEEDGISIRNIQKIIKKEKDIDISYYKIQKITEGKVKNSINKLLEEKGFDGDNRKHWWVKDEWVSVFLRNDQKFDTEQFIADLLREVKEHAPKYEKIKYDYNDEGNMLIIDLADHHFGKYASKNETSSAYNLEIAKTRFKEGIEGILQKYHHQ